MDWKTLRPQSIIGNDNMNRKISNPNRIRNTIGHHVRQQTFKVDEDVDHKGANPCWPPDNGHEYLRIVMNEASNYPEYFFQKRADTSTDHETTFVSTETLIDRGFEKSFSLDEKLLPTRENALKIARVVANLRSRFNDARQTPKKKFGIGYLTSNLKNDILSHYSAKSGDTISSQDSTDHRNPRDMILEVLPRIGHSALHNLLRQHAELVSEKNFQQKDLICFFGYIMYLEDTLRDEEMYNIRVLCKKLKQLRCALSHLDNEDNCVATINLIIIAVSFTFGQHDLYA